MTADASPLVVSGWADSGFSPNPGQFPIRVERHLNSFVAAHLPGVTTVTSAARYYALHGLIAQIGQAEGLGESSVLALLRRSEALLAYVTTTHSSSDEHTDATPAPHGLDAIRRNALTDSGLDLGTAAETYSIAKWGFSGAYRGSELTLKILSPTGFVPGEWYDHDRVASILAKLVEIARSTDHVSEGLAMQLQSACLCQMAAQKDAEWLASLLEGEVGDTADRPSLGGLLWQFGRTVAAAVRDGVVKDANSLEDSIMFNPDLSQNSLLAGLVAPARWRGALLRKESVYALRLIWRNMNDLIPGALPVGNLIEVFASCLPEVSVAEFRKALPSAVTENGQPRAAERELDDLPDLQRWLAILMIGATRLSHLTAEERSGFTSQTEYQRGQWEELSPGWFGEQLQRLHDHSLPDFGRFLATTLIHRSQRVALWKSGYRDGRFVFPARLHVRDGIAVKVYGETAPEPATRIPQYLSIARQAGMFTTDSKGLFSVGPNGHRLV